MDGITTKTSVEIDWYTLGNTLAHENSDRQGAFLDGFANGLHGLGSTGAQTQIIYILEAARGYTWWLIEELDAMKRELEND